MQFPREGTNMLPDAPLLSYSILINRTPTTPRFSSMTGPISPSQSFSVIPTTKASSNKPMLGEDLRLSQDLIKNKQVKANDF